jgi:hypothetical protein
MASQQPEHSLACILSLFKASCVALRSAAAVQLSYSQLCLLAVAQLLLCAVGYAFARRCCKTYDSDR